MTILQANWLNQAKYTVQGMSCSPRCLRCGWSMIALTAPQRLEPAQSRNPSSPSSPDISETHINGHEIRKRPWLASEFSKAQLWSADWSWCPYGLPLYTPQYGNQQGVLSTPANPHRSIQENARERFCPPFPSCMRLSGSKLSHPSLRSTNKLTKLLSSSTKGQSFYFPQSDAALSQIFSACTMIALGRRRVIAGHCRDFWCNYFISKGIRKKGKQEGNVATTSETIW